MASLPVIEAADISVAYRLARNRTTTVQEFAVRLLKRQVQYEDLWALRNVSFDLLPG